MEQLEEGNWRDVWQKNLCDDERKSVQNSDKTSDDVWIGDHSTYKESSQQVGSSRNEDAPGVFWMDIER